MNFTYIFFVMLSMVALPALASDTLLLEKIAEAAPTCAASFDQLAELDSLILSAREVASKNGSDADLAIKIR